MTDVGTAWWALGALALVTPFAIALHFLISRFRDQQRLVDLDLQLARIQLTEQFQEIVGRTRINVSLATPAESRSLLFSKFVFSRIQFVGTDPDELALYKAAAEGGRGPGVYADWLEEQGRTDEATLWRKWDDG